MSALGKVENMEAQWQKAYDLMDQRAFDKSLEDHQQLIKIINDLSNEAINKNVDIENPNSLLHKIVGFINLDHPERKIEIIKLLLNKKSTVSEFTFSMAQRIATMPFQKPQKDREAYNLVGTAFFEIVGPSYFEAHGILYK
jgi:hypothetical protein